MFPVDRTKLTGRKARCKACEAIAQKEYRSRIGTDAVRKQNVSQRQKRTYLDHRRANLWRKYKLTLEQYADMFQAQGGLCAVCGKTPRHRDNLAVDHCHETGVVRGLLCGLCNGWLGRVNDDPALAMKAIDYLRRHAEVSNAN